MEETANAGGGHAGGIHLEGSGFRLLREGNVNLTMFFFYKGVDIDRRASKENHTFEMNLPASQ